MTRSRVVGGLIAILIVALIAAFPAARPALAQGETCMRIGGDLIVGPDEHCSGDAVAIGGDVLVQGFVGGNAVAVGGSVQVNGRVVGDVVSVGGGVELSRGAFVGGNVSALGGALRRAPGAVVGGNVLESGLTLPIWSTAEGGRPLVSVGLRLLGAVLASGLALGLSLLFALSLGALWPRRTQVMAATLRHQPAACFGMGLVTGLLLALLLPIVSFLLVLTIIGIVLVPVLVIAVVLFYLAALTVTGLAVGETLVARAGNQSAAPWLAAIIGLAIVAPLSVFPGVLIPCLGPFWAALVPSAGVGAIVLSRVGTWCRPGIDVR